MLKISYHNRTYSSAPQILPSKAKMKIKVILNEPIAPRFESRTC